MFFWYRFLVVYNEMLDVDIEANCLFLRMSESWWCWGLKQFFYEGMKIAHSLYFCLYKTLLANEQTDDMENNGHCLFW